MIQFKDLIFKEHTHMINARHVFENDWEISVSAGAGAYSTPREDIKDPAKFSSFEIAIFNPDGDFVTKDFVPDAGDDVLGWQDRGQINALMLLIQSNVKVK